MNIKAEEVWPLILDFIEQYVGKAELKAFKKYFKVKVDQSEDPLVKAGGMKTILQSFFKHNKKAYKVFMQSRKGS